MNTTILVSRSGFVYDLGKTKRVQVSEKGKDGSERVVERIVPTEYPPWKGKGRSVIPDNMAAFGMCCSQAYCDELKNMSRDAIRKRFKL